MVIVNLNEKDQFDLHDMKLQTWHHSRVFIPPKCENWIWKAATVQFHSEVFECYAK